MKNIKIVIIGKKVLFCDKKNTMMWTQSPSNFFVKSLRILRPLIPENFSMIGEGHCKRGRFPVELPIYKFIFAITSPL